MWQLSEILWKLVDVTVISYSGCMSITFMDHNLNILSKTLMSFGIKHLNYKVPWHKKLNRVHHAAEMG